MTIEKLINRFHLAEAIGSHESFKKITRCKVNETYREFLKYELENVDLGRLQFYREVKNNNNIEKYLKLEDFEHRKIIAKLRCSDHTLEIEKGRHGKMERSERLCKQCNNGAIETEAHFLLECKIYDTLKQKTQFI